LLGAKVSWVVPVWVAVIAGMVVSITAQESGEPIGASAKEEVGPEVKKLPAMVNAAAKFVGLMVGI
jgi:hypothetical protein